MRKPSNNQNCAVLLILASLVVFSTCEEYIVRTNTGENARILKLRGIKFNHEYDFGDHFNGFSVNLSPENLLQIQQIPGISITKSKPFLFPNNTHKYQINDSLNTTEWNLDQLDGIIDKKYTYEGDGDGVDAYVVDSGINVEHPQLQGRAVWGANFCTKEKNIDYDTDGHGTHVAGIIGSKDYGVAKKVTMIAVKVSGEAGGNQADLLAGLNWVYKKKLSTGRPSVVNLSMGLAFDEDINSAVKALTEIGVPVVAAAGNFMSDACGVSPASSPFVFTVAASAVNNTIWPKTNYGKCVNIIAPGVEIKSLRMRQGAWTMTGTSQACPHVAGVVAQALSLKKFESPSQVFDYIISKSAKDVVKGKLKATPNVLLRAL